MTRRGQRRAAVPAGGQRFAAANGRTRAAREATALNPGEPSSLSRLGDQSYRVVKSRDGVTEAVNLLRKAVSEQENLAGRLSVLGLIAYARGQAPKRSNGGNAVLIGGPGMSRPQ